MGQQSVPGKHGSLKGPWVAFRQDSDYSWFWDPFGHPLGFKETPKSTFATEKFRSEGAFGTNILLGSFFDVRMGGVEQWKLSILFDKSCKIWGWGVSQKCIRNKSQKASEIISSSTHWGLPGCLFKFKIRIYMFIILVFNAHTKICFWNYLLSYFVSRTCVLFFQLWSRWRSYKYVNNVP